MYLNHKKISSVASKHCDNNVLYYYYYYRSFIFYGLLLTVKFLCWLKIGKEK